MASTGGRCFLSILHLRDNFWISYLIFIIEESGKVLSGPYKNEGLKKKSIFFSASY